MAPTRPTSTALGKVHAADGDGALEYDEFRTGLKPPDSSSSLQVQTVLCISIPRVLGIDVGLYLGSEVGPIGVGVFFMGEAPL